MEHTSSKKIVLWVILIFIIFLSVIGVTFSFFTYTRTSTNEPTIQAGKAVIGYVEETNGISLTDALPTSDVNALNTTNSDHYFDFYVTYDFSDYMMIQYEIDIENTTNSLTDIQNGILTSISTSRIKVALEDRSTTLPDEPMVVSPTYFSVLENTAASNGQAGYRLYSKTVSGTGTDYYRLYMWLPEVDDADVAIPLVDMDGVEGIQNQAFSVRINVHASTQS